MAQRGSGSESFVIAPIPEMDEYTNEWKNSVFSCNNASICCESVACYYCLHGYIFNELKFFGGDDGQLEPEFCNAYCILIPVIDLMGYASIGLTNSSRQGVRTRYKIKETICGGCFTQYFCPCCAAAQLALELDSHGDWGGSCFSKKSSQPRETTKENAPLTEYQRRKQQEMVMQQQAQLIAQQTELITQQLYRLQQQEGGISTTAGQQPGMMMQTGMKQAQAQPAQPGFVVDPYQQQQQQQPVAAFASTGFVVPPPPRAMN